MLEFPIAPFPSLSANLYSMMSVYLSDECFAISKLHMIRILYITYFIITITLNHHHHHHHHLFTFISMLEWAGSILMFIHLAISFFIYLSVFSVTYKNSQKLSNTYPTTNACFDIFFSAF